MQTTRIYRLNHLPPSMMQRLREAQEEAARVWMQCRDLHLEARKQHLPWPGRIELQKATKGQFALHSQTVQMICHKFLSVIEMTRQTRRQNPRLRYPHKDKRFHPLYWPTQAVSYERGRVVLPMGRGRRSLVLKLDVPEGAGACQIAWRDGYELHVMFPCEPPAEQPGDQHAAVDLGEIHLAAVTTSDSAALVVSGRGIRTLKRSRHVVQRRISLRLARCQRGSKRWKRLVRARHRHNACVARRVRDLRHKATRAVVEFCAAHGVGKVYIGNPRGVRRHWRGKRQNQRMGQWEYRRDIEYLTGKCAQRGIESFTGPEWGPSSRCPECGARHKPKNREWKCPRCNFSGHRDVVGSANMHVLAFGEPISFPPAITYRRAGPVRVASRNEQPRRVARAGMP